MAFKTKRNECRMRKQVCMALFIFRAVGTYSLF